MNLGIEILSKLTVFSKYARYVPSIKRRETWDEIVDRYQTMLVKKYPLLKDSIERNSTFIREKKVLPSMRCLQFAGLAAEVNNARTYNCAFCPIDSIYSFSEIMFLLLGGTGCGYSVQRHHVDMLPPVYKANKKKRIWLVEDSIMGWSDAIKVLMKCYLNGGFKPVFDYRAIRPKGAKLVTAGGKAPGPEPLKICIAHIEAILERKNDGEKLTPLECHDIICHIANSVLAGGIRRSACLSLFSIDDEEMMTCKYGNWYETNEQRGRCNNSVVLERGKVTEEQFFNIWKRIEASGSGEPGIYWTNNREVGCNPCCEISLRPYSFCNLCEVNVSDVEDQYELDERVSVASFFGTLQAGVTDFHYLRPIWKTTTDEDALLGISLTGIASGKVLSLDLSSAASEAKIINADIADIIGINKASRLCCIKPAGTTSNVLGTSSGIHAWHSKYYLRTMRFNKNEDIALYLMCNHPEICEDDVLRPNDTICVRVPVKAPEGAILRDEPVIDLLERIKKFYREWIIVGHIKGDNTHNISATISIKEDEWQMVGQWLWMNKDYYNGISVLPYFNHVYKQAPFEEITEKKYLSYVSHIKDIDLTKVIEIDDVVDFGQIVACGGGLCEIHV